MGPAWIRFRTQNRVSRVKAYRFREEEAAQLGASRATS